MNRMQLIGRLGRDPEGGQNANGGFATFSLAAHEFWTDRASGELVEHTEWHHLVCYDRLAEIALAFLTKGREIYVEGRVRLRLEQQPDKAPGPEPQFTRSKQQPK